MVRQYWVVTLAVFWAVSVTSQPRPNGPLRPNLEPLRVAIERLVRSYYPKAQVTLDGETIHFESNTRKFMIHEPLLTGEWQDAREESGPQKGGIYGDLELRSGLYKGQAMVPQTFDKRYFTLLVMAPYDPAHDAHLYIHVKYPAGPSQRFLEDFGHLVNQFDKLVFTQADGRAPN